MALVTLIGEKQNRIGFEFIYIGPNTQPECKGCKLKTVCFNLQEGQAYRVVRARNIHHDCSVHEEGVRVVEVERIATSVALPAKLAVEGATITYQPPGCENIGCEHYRLCNPWGLKPDQKIRVATIKNEISCGAGHQLVSVDIE